MIRNEFLNPDSPTVVIGDGWSALAAIRFLRTANQAVIWVQGSGARILAPLPSLAHGPGVAAWRKLAEVSGIEAGEEHSGCFLREFRNKAFREPLWTKTPTLPDRQDVLSETLWAPERTFTGAFETRFELTVEEIEAAVRAGLTDVERVEGLPVESFKTEGKRITAVVLGSGRAIECSQLIYADSWSLLSGIGGMPKGIPFARKREAVGVFQAVFQHETPVGADGIEEGFYSQLHRESGDDRERHVFGYFLDGGMKSIWSSCVSADEVEDNHQIAKKLRRMKSAIEKMFAGPGWIQPAEARPPTPDMSEGLNLPVEVQGPVRSMEPRDFLTNIRSEQFRFAPDAAFASGEPVLAPERLSAFQNASFLTDGYGPSCALAQVAALLFEPAELQAQAEGVNLVPASGV
jgi:hypothetical protein